MSYYMYMRVYRNMLGEQWDKIISHIWDIPQKNLEIIIYLEI